MACGCNRAGLWMLFANCTATATTTLEPATVVGCSSPPSPPPAHPAPPPPLPPPLLPPRPSLGSQLLSASITVNLPRAIPSGKPSAQLRRNSPSGALVLDLGCSWQASESRTTWQCNRVQTVRLSASDNSNLASLFLSIFYVLPEPFAYNTLG